MFKSIMKYVTITAVALTLFMGSNAVAADPAVATPTNTPAIVAVTPTFTAPAVTPKWQITAGAVGGTSANGEFGADWRWGGEFSLARKVVIDLGTPFETDLGVRQSFSYGTIGKENQQCFIREVDAPCANGSYTEEYCTYDKKSGWTFRTEIFWDWNFRITEKFSFFVGPCVSAIYGEGISPQWAIGPEAGLKYAFTEGFFAYTRVNYDWNFSNGPDGFRASAGLGWNL